ncbi:MAG: hypothetical protein QOC67_5786, partial [Pseudonocardiales bacterium]|nr:hypothetical protein [Pseudonocardiales bacterium]
HKILDSKTVDLVVPPRDNTHH